MLNTLQLKNNALKDMEELSDPFGGMERLNKMDCRGNPLCALPKYRDYIVILCKSLCKKMLSQNNWITKKFYQPNENI